MVEEKAPATGLAPVFLLVDDDREAAQRMLLAQPGDWFFIPVYQPSQAVRYAKQFGPTAVLLAEPIPYSRGGAGRLLQELLDEVGKPVIILTESCNPETAEQWRRMGAADCIPHPTRSFSRMCVLRDTLKKNIEEPGLAAALTATIRLQGSSQKRK